MNWNVRPRLALPALIMSRATTFTFVVATFLFCAQDLVAQGVMISTGSLPAGVVNAAYSQTLTAINGSKPYTWSVASGFLPAGLALAPSTGVISGTPTAEGTSSFRVRVTTSSLQPDEKNFNIMINRASVTTGGADLQIKTQSLSSGLQNSAYTQQLDATGGSTPYTWSVTGGPLPQGLALTPAGILQGTPTAAGSAKIQIRVTDSSGTNVKQDFTIVIAPPLGSLSFTGLPPMVNPAQQLPLALSISKASPVMISGTLSIAFAASAAAPGDDPAVQFSTGGRSLNFTVPANGVAALLPSQLSLLTGTVAGTITITGRIQNGPANLLLASVGVRSMIPQIRSVAASRVSDGLKVQITGYSTERSITAIDFAFDVRTAVGTQRVNLSRSVEQQFRTWYQSQASLPFGSTFLFEQSFGVQGDSTAIDAVTVTLTNGQGSAISSRVAIQ